MTVTIERSFNPMTDRYAFDFKRCTYADGWFQVDTYQDAGYFGIWTNPTLRQIVTYAEGDITKVLCDTDEEYAEQVRDCCDHYTDGTERWPHAKIDAGLKNREVSVARFTELGLKRYIH